MKRLPAILALTAVAALLGGLAVVMERGGGDAVPTVDTDTGKGVNHQPVESKEGTGSPETRGTVVQTAPGNVSGSAGEALPASSAVTVAPKAQPMPGGVSGGPSVPGRVAEATAATSRLAWQYGLAAPSTTVREVESPAAGNLLTSSGSGVVAARAVVAVVAADAPATEAQADPALVEARPEVVESEEPLVTPLEVIQVASRWEDDLLEVSYAVLVDDDPYTVTPSGLILTQEIPEGWQVINAEPQLQAVDESNRMVKWLFVGQEVESKIVYSLSMRVPEGAEGDWNKMLAWYTYRQPDGSCVDVAVGTVPESDIQPDW